MRRLLACKCQLSVTLAFKFYNGSRNLYCILVISIHPRERSWLRCCAISRKVADSVADKVIDFFFNFPNPSSRAIALASTQLPAEMSTTTILGGNGLPARKADNLTAIC
jgi:hypothetical protein